MRSWLSAASGRFPARFMVYYVLVLPCSSKTSVTIPRRTQWERWRAWKTRWPCARMVEVVFRRVVTLTEARRSPRSTPAWHSPEPSAPEGSASRRVLVRLIEYRVNRGGATETSAQAQGHHHASSQIQLVKRS